MAKKSAFVGELLHFNGVRLRVTGSGNLKTSLHSLNEVHNADLVDLDLDATTNKEPVILANYIEQMGFLRIKTTVIDEHFSISKIVVFIRPVATGYPQ